MSPDRSERPGATAGDPSAAGDLVVRADVAGTALFVVAATTAAAIFNTPAQWFGAITSLTLFVVGCCAFLWAFYNAVQRSRREQISVTQLFLLLGDPTPRAVRRTMNAMLLLQCVAAVATALSRPNTADGSPGSSLALGILVPMFGLGMNGLWAAFHGSFPSRDVGRGSSCRPDGDLGGHDERTSSVPIDKNDAHG